MTDVIRARDLKVATEEETERAKRLVRLRSTPFEKFSADDKDFLLKELLVRCGLLDAVGDDK